MTDLRLHRIVADQTYPLLFATISGAHLYGVPSPDSGLNCGGACIYGRRWWLNTLDAGVV